MRQILLGLLAAALTWWPPTTHTQTVTHVLTGRVVTAAAGEMRPVRRAKVTLAGGTGAPRVADTDVKGEYRFDRLAAADYKVTVQKPGFVKLEVAATPDATLTMVRGGAIEGVVTDTAGDPIFNVVVSALQPQSEGKPKAVAETRTDDRGHYRLHSLPEGDYLVEAATDRMFLQSLFAMPGEERPEINRSYFPGGATLEAARPVRASLGRDTAAVDVTLGQTTPLKDPAAPAPPPRPDATGTARIAGRVLDATSGRPIKNARLLLLPIEGQRLTNWTRTDAQGGFAYSSLQARRYTLDAQAERYVKLAFGQQRPGETGTQIELRDGAEFTADIKLPRASALEGTLLDEFGDPAPNVTLQAARRQYVSGRHRLMPAEVRPAATDDQGHYRISGVPPGEYYVSALSGVYTDVNEVGGFAPTYYPGTTDSGAAAAITVALGVDATASFSLVPARTFTVSGRMVDTVGRPVSGRGALWLSTPDKLQRADFNLARATTAPDGSFVLRNVPEGSYTLQGFGPPPPGYKGPGNLGAMRFGWLALTVGDMNLDDVILKVTDGTTLRGKVVLEDTAVSPPVAEQVRVSTVPVEFDSAPVGGGPAPSETHADLSFEVIRLSGMRRIFVDVSSPNWALKKITLNEFDVTDAPVDFRTKDVEGLEVVLSPKVSRITGSVSDDKGPIGDYALLIFASDPTKWIDRSRFVQLVRPTQQGRFDVRGVPPEDYLAIALPSVDGSEWQDPEFLQQLRAQATPFVLGEGESRTLDLKLKKRP